MKTKDVIEYALGNEISELTLFLLRYAIEHMENNGPEWFDEEQDFTQMTELHLEIAYDHLQEEIEEELFKQMKKKKTFDLLKILDVKKLKDYKERKTLVFNFVMNVKMKDMKTLFMSYRDDFFCECGNVMSLDENECSECYARYCEELEER